MNNRDLLLTPGEVHQEWQEILDDALGTLDTEYLGELLASNLWLPGRDYLFSAFRRDLSGVRYVLIGESPYPRRESANGIAFYDAAVDQLWSHTGLSKSVNRATSLRNLIKAALLAEGYIEADSEGKISQACIAELDKSKLVNRLSELFSAFQDRGFLMLNATPVLFPHRKPLQEARYWHKFLLRLLERLADGLSEQATLVLWGKIAETIEPLSVASRYRKLICEHPYNLSFIHNPAMRSLFAELKLLGSAGFRQA